MAKEQDGNTPAVAPAAAPRAGARYLYAVVNGDPESYPALGTIGIDGGEVTYHRSGALAAVTSRVAGGRLRPERRHLTAHHAVLKRLVEHHTVLPVKFGHIAESVVAVLQMLDRNREALTAQLHALAGTVEMGLRIRWDVPNIFEYFVRTHPELRAVRDQLFGRLREPSVDEKLEVGRLFDRLLREDREAYTQQVETVLAPQCADLRRNALRGEHEVADLACLIAREGRAAFEAAVFEAARLFDDSFAFDYTGPWPPHHFVEVRLQP